MLLWHKKIPIVELVAHGVNTLGDKIANKKVDVKVSVDVEDSNNQGLISVKPIIPQDMQDQDGQNPAFTDFANQTINVYKAIIEEKQLTFNGQLVTVAVTNNNKLQLTANNQILTQMQAQGFMEAHAHVFAECLQDVYNKHVELEVDAPRLQI